jgi:hypothetical protein
MQLLAAPPPLHGGINREENILKISNEFIHFEATRKQKYFLGKQNEAKKI